jgi:hypothetical protein
MSERVAETLARHGCRSVHIGGGEPFLDYEGLLRLLGVLKRARISVDYVETNAFWASDEAETLKRLSELKRAGADAFCISRDDFHAEFVPDGLPLKLAEACRRADFGYFIWSTGEGSIRFGGRAVNIEKQRMKNKPVAETVNSRPCAGLLSTNHFHVDLHGNFIPPGCTGIRIPLEEAVSGICPIKYPVFNALLTGGAAELLGYAEKRGFRAADEGYPSSCAMCFWIRYWLTENAPSLDLDPEHYIESLKY